ncbi:MAG: tRNA 5-methoxyuridine(34)/uridine 5-oxyacetic acid(34) synthase CmoB [Gammaproteobacteria bacterium]
MRLYQPLFELMRDSELEPWLKLLPEQIERGLSIERHGNLDRWQQVVDSLPDYPPQQLELNVSAIRVNQTHPLSDEQQHQLRQRLKQLMPWRKGPYHIHGVDIDTEWRSDWKWDRLSGHIQALKGRKILDVGCGNGYHGWRMLGEGAELVIGIDPSALFVMQYRAIRHFLGALPMYVLPLGIEAVPENLHAFDTVFSMGVLYHRRSPIDHLLQLKSCLRPGGELVLETLIIEGDEQQALVPQGRYGKMRNVWFLPSAQAMQLWLRRCGFKQVQLLDVSTTTTEEQRATEWMTFESLNSFLDPHNPSLTVEGYPAPVRAIFSAIVD